MCLTQRFVCDITKRCRAGNAVINSGSNLESRKRPGCHIGSPAQKQYRTAYKRRVCDIASDAAIQALYDDDRNADADGEHPDREVRGHIHREDCTGNTAGKITGCVGLFHDLVVAIFKCHAEDHAQKNTNQSAEAKEDCGSRCSGDQCDQYIQHGPSGIQRCGNMRRIRYKKSCFESIVSHS